MSLESPAPSRKSPYTKPAPMLELTTYALWLIEFGLSSVPHRSPSLSAILLRTGRVWERGECRGMGCVRALPFFSIE